MRQYKDLAVKDPRMAVFNLNSLRADCNMSRWALCRFSFECSGRRSHGEHVAVYRARYGLYRVTSGDGQHTVLALMETREAHPRPR
jgi:hypothetical protein